MNRPGRTLPTFYWLLKYMSKRHRLILFRISLIFILSMLLQNIYAQETQLRGAYVYKHDKDSGLYFKVDFLESGKFKYIFKIDLVSIESEGIYKVSNDSIILNNGINPMEVDESFDSDNDFDEVIEFKICAFLEDDCYYPNYNIYFVSREDTLQYTSQSESIKLDKRRLSRYSSFYILGVYGMQYPTYEFKDRSINQYFVKLNPKISFNDEAWLIEGNKVKPRGLNKKLTRGFLYKEE